MSKRIDEKKERKHKTSMKMILDLLSLIAGGQHTAKDVVTFEILKSISGLNLNFILIFI